MKIKEYIVESLETERVKSAWDKARNQYALEILEDIDAAAIEAVKNGDELEKLFLNGAKNWKEYSYGGCSLIYNEDIASRLSTPSEFKRTKGGDIDPNPRENWLDCQARCLLQAFMRIQYLFDSFQKIQKDEKERVEREFKSDLRALLEKYNASIDFCADDSSDWYGITGEHICAVIERNWIKLADGTAVEASDL